MSQSDALKEPGVTGQPLASAAPLPTPPPKEFAALLVIGQGGMGTVEVALERSCDARGRIDERIVALKRLVPEACGNPRHREMFLREARLATQLSHPNVVRGFSFGEQGEGELFLAMEYVEGESLNRILSALRKAGRKLPAAIAAYALALACDGLHAAHELRDETGALFNVVHRDVSPHNVMFSYQGDIKLLDFGVAKFDAGGHKTRTGEVKGKMAYMSPEQAMGEKLDRRSDLYAIGAILFECLTGERMWGEGTDVDIMRRLALEEPPRLDVALPTAPLEMVALYSRLVAREPAGRPASARAVADELRAFLAARTDHVTAATVAAFMHQVFPGVAAKRRHDLRQRLAAVSAKANADAAFGPLPSDPTDETRASSSFVVPMSRRRWLAWGGIAAAVGGLVAAGLSPLVNREARERAPQGVTSAEPTVATAAPPPLVPIASAAPRPLGSSAPAVSPSAPRPRATPRGAPPRASATPHSSQKPPRSPPDVDPTPF